MKLTSIFQQFKDTVDNNRRHIDMPVLLGLLRLYHMLCFAPDVTDLTFYKDNYRFRYSFVPEHNLHCFCVELNQRPFSELFKIIYSTESEQITEHIYTIGA